MRAHIKAISYYLPEKILTNKDLCTIFPGLSEKEIFAATGVKNRHISEVDEICSDMAFSSAQILFEEYNINKEDIDFIIFCTQGFDYRAPATSCILQDRLGLPKHCGAIDLPYGCSGFTYGISLAKALIESRQAKNVLFLTSEAATKVVHPDDSELRLIFGDGAAATLVSVAQNDETGIGDFVFGTDGKGAENLIVRSSGLREPITVDWLNKYKDANGMRIGKMEMKGTEIFIFALRVVPPMVRQLLDKANLTPNDIDLFVFHQASGFLLETLRRKMKIPSEKYFVSLENCGNTVSASIPIALKEAMKEGKIKKGNKVLIAGFGIGNSWAGTIIEF